LYGLKLGQQAAPKTLIMEKSCFDIVSISRGVLKSITLLGNLFIRKQATRKASPQNYRGTDE
jgi:hypothetical protein